MILGTNPIVFLKIIIKATMLLLFTLPCIVTNTQFLKESYLTGFLLP